MGYGLITLLAVSVFFVISQAAPQKSNEHQANDVRETLGEREARLMTQSPKTISYAPPPQSIEHQLYRSLLCMAKGDSALTDRLIAYEARRNPNACRTEHIDAAIWRWRRDLQ
jgi:hypothetical protein